jgi:hypothetical protein
LGRGVPCRRIGVRSGEALAPEPKGAWDVFEAFHDARVRLLSDPIIEAVTSGPKAARGGRLVAGQPWC